MAYAVAWATLAVVWSLTAKTSSGLPLTYAARIGVTIMATAAILGVGVWHLTRFLPWDRRSAAFYVVHVIAALIYGLSFTLSAALLDLLRGDFGRAIGMSLRSGVFGWNVLMGSWLYLIVAGLSYGIRAQQKLDQQAKAEAEARMLAERAQLAALRARLNPHFLFNALHTVSSLVATDPAAADAAIERLGSLLRYALDESTDAIPLEREWGFTRDYLSFERLRLGDRLRVREALDVDALSTDVPLFVLQPLVENAVRHAVAVSPAGGTIQITGRVDRGTLLLSVEDDGPGGDRPGIENSRGLGLRALKRRLEVRYGAQARVDIRTAPGAGFAVTVVLPAERSLAAGAA